MRKLSYPRDQRIRISKDEGEDQDVDQYQENFSRLSTTGCAVYLSVARSRSLIHLLSVRTVLQRSIDGIRRG